MPSLTRHPRTGIFQYRARVPAALVEKARGKALALPIGHDLRTVRIGREVKVSLGTRDPSEGKHRFTEVAAAVQEFWQTLRDGPKRLTRKQVMALAGEVRAAFISAMDDDPGAAKLWQDVKEANDYARSGGSRLFIGTPAERMVFAMEKRFGGLADAALARRGLDVLPESRWSLLREVGLAMDDVARVNAAKAEGDYSDSGDTARYPKWEDAAPAPVEAKPAGITFGAVIDAEVRHRSLGKDSAAVLKATEAKFRRHTGEFARHRKSDDATTVTQAEARAWMLSLQEAGARTNRTIKDMLSSVRAVLAWGHGRFPESFPAQSPIHRLKTPKAVKTPSWLKTYTEDEARAILATARKESRPALRWLPWLCAYTGMRIGEAAGLTKADFQKRGQAWFVSLVEAGARRLKTSGSVRRIPLHPALVEEGLISFVQAAGPGRLFIATAPQRVGEWIRGEVGISRPEVAPNHGWRHLFEDLCLRDGVQEGARRYITGRGTGTSADDYGRSDALLPALAREIQKIVPFEVEGDEPATA